MDVPETSVHWRRLALLQDALAAWRAQGRGMLLFGSSAEELRAGLGEDVRRILMEALPEILDALYVEIARIPELAPLVESHATVARLKEAQRAHWEAVFAGAFDQQYADRARRVGETHYVAGVDPGAFLLGHNFVTSRLNVVLVRSLPAERAAQAVQHLGKLATVDVCLALDAYWAAAGREFARIESEMHRLALYDSLTRLANRRLFDDRLRQALRAADRGGHMVGVLRLDVDDFKSLNDGYGHQAGDLVLRLVGRRLTRHLRRVDTAARIGGDEFAIIVPGFARMEDFAEVARRILRVLGRPYRYRGRRIHSTVSVGCALYPRHGLMPESLLANADRALYRAKSRGRNRYEFYQGKAKRARLPSGWLSDFDRAFENRQLRFFYQPQIDLQSGRVRGFEALLRWHHPRLGLITPERFLPVVERSPLMHRLATWSLERGCRMLARLQAETGFTGNIAVNLSQTQIRGRRLVEAVERALAEAGVPAERLELEMTEDVLIEQKDRQLHDRLRHLRHLGVTIALDDFGTGYASLVHLSRLPVDCLKLDRSFVADITHGATARRIAQTVVRLGRHIHARVVAEGVETEEQVDMLRRMQCHLGQGYWFARPLPEEEVSDWLRARGERSETSPELRLTVSSPSLTASA